MNNSSGSRKPNGPMVKNYLLAYNAIQTAGWSYILCVTLVHLLINGSSTGLWEKIGCPLKIFQTLAVLEVIHAAIKLVPSGVTVTALQLASRLFIVWGIYWSVPQINDCFAVPIIALAWAPTETIRYSYYFLNILHVVPYFLTWCRYTFFIVLYPLGVVGEMSSIFSAMSYIQNARLYSAPLPIFSFIYFNYSYLVLLVAWSFLPIFPMLYSHMFSQRKKVLAPKKKSE